VDVAVQEKNLHEVIENLSKEQYLSFDTETTGLSPYNGSELFAVVISSSEADYYFDFNEGGLDRGYIKEFTKLFVGSDNTRFAHNAKFDLHFLSKEGVEVGDCKIHDTEVIARVIYNQHSSYKLADVASRYGMEKLGSEVDEVLTFEETVDKLGVVDKRPCYEKVPFDVMYRYAIRDSRITFDVGMKQLSELGDVPALQIEYGATKALFNMERVGVKTDSAYVQSGYELESKRVDEYKAQLDAIFGGEFVDHADQIAGVLGELPKTPDGNNSAAAWVLEKINTDVSRLILSYRDALKRKNTYWANIIRYADDNGVIHPNFRQAGAQTLRTSCSAPNMQNQSKDDDSAVPLRKAFVPREGYTFVELDFAAQEFRLAVDYASERRLAEDIRNGYDPHTAAANLTGLERKKAKVMNFALLYGCGAAKLGGMLGCSADEAKVFKAKYFHKLPGIKSFIYRASDAAKLKGFVKNWAGVKYYFTDPSWAYKAANSIIQGGCAYISKNALWKIDEFLRPYKSRMVLQVHDSILLEMPESEFHLISEIQNLMIESYPHKIMPMGASVEWSRASWGDLIKGMPDAGSGVSA